LEHRNSVRLPHRLHCDSCGTQTRHEREQSRARRDFLTQAANAEMFADISRVQIERARRSKLPISIAYIDCDDFKLINARFGHQTGDQVLKVVAATLTEGLRTSDLVARLGGDEFAGLLPDTPSQPAQQIFHACEHSCSSVCESTAGPSLSVSASRLSLRHLSPLTNCSAAGTNEFHSP
jgi:diguanylate cyclase (GGDEF)-like protein